MIAVTGATGHLGRLAVQELLDRGVEPGSVVAAVRSPEKAADLADRGVRVRRADYDEQETLGPALDGVDRLLLISGSEVGQRARQHGNVVEAAVEAGVDLLVYTSILKADSSGARLAGEHRTTEEEIRASGLPFVFLRNSWYLENYTAQLPQYLEHGMIPGAAGDGRVSAATRADYAAAAAFVLTTDGHENATYELGGDDAFTMTELAAEVSRQSGRTVTYRDMSEEEYASALAEAGVPEGYARVLADSDRAVARGELFTDSGHLRRLIGRSPTSLSDAIRQVLGTS